MSDAHVKSTGRDYSLTAAWLAIAAIFIPIMLLAFRPGALISSLAFLCAAVGVTMAWVTWKRSSKLTIPTFAVQSKVRND